MTTKERITGLNLRPDQVGIFYLGQMGFIIKYCEKYIMVDGYLTDYVDTHFSTPSLKWERLYPGPIKPDELDFLDYVFCTHPHGDHADPQTLVPVAKCSGARFLVPSPMTEVLEQFGVPTDRITGLFTDVDYSLCEGVSVRAIPAAHEELHPAGENAYEEVGYVFTLGDITLYHSGDSCIYDGLEQRIKGTDIMMMPINGRDYFRLRRDDIIGCFDAYEAITLAKNAGARLLIPAHFGLYAVNTVNPANFLDLLQRENITQSFHIFTPGEAYIYDAGLFTE